MLNDWFGVWSSEFGFTYPHRVAPVVALPVEAVKMQAAVNFLPTKCRVRPVSKEAQHRHDPKGGTEK